MTEPRPETHPWREDVPACALGALDAGERAALEAHLDGCASCRALLAEERALVESLAHAAPRIAPPAALRDRVLAEARAGAAATRVVTAEVPAAAAEHVVAVRAAPREGPVVVDLDSRRHRAARLPWALAAASVIAALGLGSAWQRERTALRVAEAQVRAASTELATRDSVVADRDALLAAVLAPDVATIQLAASASAPSMRLYWNARQRTMVLTAAQLPPARAGRAYQLWGIVPGEAPRSLGTFNTDANGRATVAMRVPEGTRFAVTALTEEPAGGSPAPTTTPFMVGEWKG